MNSSRVQVVASTRAGPFERVIGSVDALGAGIEHPLVDVNPFVLMDQPPVLTQAGVPDFGLHPHYGLHVASLVWTGCVKSRLATDAAFTRVVGPAVLAVFAGRGMAHEESTATSEPCLMTQLIWRIPTASMCKPCRVSRVEPAQWHDCGNGARILVAVGSALGHSSPVETETPVTVVMGTLQGPGARMELPQLAGGCFVYARSGALRVNGIAVPCHHVAVVPSAEGVVAIEHDDGDEVDFLFGNGRAIDEPWVKLKTQNGFLLAASLDDALAQEELSRRVGLETFGN